MPLIHTSSGKQYTANDGESLLDAALRNDVVLAYSCHTGRCSTCKGKVRTGSTVALRDEVGLSRAEREAGWILTCVRTANSDVDLDVEDLGTVRLLPARTIPCRIHTLERLASDVIRVVLRLPPGSDFDYLPGQYVEVIGAGGARRSYSIANAPRADKLIELHIRQVPGGVMSEYWFGQAKTNDLLRLNGPLGTFFLRETAGKDLVCLATGTGIAPCKAMLEGLATMPQVLKPRSVVIYWGGRIQQDLYWEPKLLGIEHRFVPVLSRPAAGWAGRQGYVQQAFLADQPLLAETAVYACGSDAMIHSARSLLVTSGLPEPQFHSDAFVCSAAN